MRTFRSSRWCLALLVAIACKRQAPVAGTVKDDIDAGASDSQCIAGDEASCTQADLNAILDDINKQTSIENDAIAAETTYLSSLDKSTTDEAPATDTALRLADPVADLQAEQVKVKGEIARQKAVLAELEEKEAVIKAAIARKKNGQTADSSPFQTACVAAKGTFHKGGGYFEVDTCICAILKFDPTKSKCEINSSDGKCTVFKGPFPLKSPLPVPTCSRDRPFDGYAPTSGNCNDGRQNTPTAAYFCGGGGRGYLDSDRCHVLNKDHPETYDCISRRVVPK